MHDSCNDPEPAFFGASSNMNNQKSTKDRLTAAIRKIDLVFIGDPGSGKRELASLLARRQDDLLAYVAMYQQESSNFLGKRTKPSDDILEVTLKVVPSGNSSTTELEPGGTNLAVPATISSYLSRDSTKERSKEVAEVIVLCVPVNTLNTIQRLKTHWLPQLCEPDVVDLPVICVGTKADLRQSEVFLNPELVAGTNNRLVNAKNAQALAQWIGAVSYVEVSARSQAGLMELYEAIAVAANLCRKDRKRQSTKRRSSHMMASEGSTHSPVTVVVVGDGECGKNSMIRVFRGEAFPSDDTPYVQTTIQSYEAIVHLVDTSTRHEAGVRVMDVPLTILVGSGRNAKDGTIDFINRFRGLCYGGANVVLLCYAVDDPLATRRIPDYWAKEIASQCPNVPVVLVALKTDLRTSPTAVLRRNPIGTDEGKAMAAAIGAEAYVECSARTSPDDVQKVFETAVRALLDTEQYHRRHCLLM